MVVCDAQAVTSTVQHMDRFYHNVHPFPSFSAFQGFLSGSASDFPVSLPITLIIDGIIRTFSVSFIPESKYF
jgi:hypothetical protein